MIQKCIQHIMKGKKCNDKYSKFTVGDHVKVSKYKNVFAKGYIPNWSEKVFAIKKVNSTVSWTFIINDCNGDEVVGMFYKKELQKTNQKEFRIKNIIKKKEGKLFVKCEGYDNSFNSWIDKKDAIE